MPVPSFEEITPEYIERLLQDRVPENFHLDYKEILEDKPQEFAKDISSFANTEGGLILYGIAEEKKITGQSTATPKSPPPGITGLNLDTLGRKYANWLEDCTDLVIRGFRQKVVSVGDKDILAIRIARSISAPHAVHNGGQGVRFWKRREYGAFTPMALEVKSMFLE